MHYQGYKRSSNHAVTSNQLLNCHRPRVSLCFCFSPTAQGLPLAFVSQLVYPGVRPFILKKFGIDRLFCLLACFICFKVP